ncbi:MAG: hypothetical protein MZU91_07220 [Desulfosudis oleivorans]|nr:hypothetical protein [Desulfosudis oleivorans]
MLWKPSEESIRQTNMHRFMQFVNAKHNQKFDEYAALYRVVGRPHSRVLGGHVGICRDHPLRALSSRWWTTSTKMPGARMVLRARA